MVYQEPSEGAAKLSALQLDQAVARRLFSSQFVSRCGIEIGGLRAGRLSDVDIQALTISVARLADRGFVWIRRVGRVTVVSLNRERLTEVEAFIGL